MNNSFKGAMPKDKSSLRSPSTGLSRRDIHDNVTKTGKMKSANKFVEKYQDGSSCDTLNGLGTSPRSSRMNEFQRARPSDEMNLGYELAAKPKVPCIPMFSESEPIKGVRSLNLDGDIGAEVVYKGKDIEDSSLSVLFVGSKSRLDLQNCNPVK